jgi:hypothetical protein
MTHEGLPVMRIFWEWFESDAAKSVPHGYCTMELMTARNRGSSRNTSRRGSLSE